MSKFIVIFINLDMFVHFISESNTFRMGDGFDCYSIF